MIRVGGSTEVEVKEKKDRVDDALNATRAAVEEGIVPGGGVALLKASKALDGLKGDNDDQNAGIAIVRRALQAPIRQIAENAGVEGSIVVGKVLENDSATFGFNAQTEEYVDLVKAGVIDPAKVVRTALQDAASVAGLLITTEAAIAEAPKKGGGGAGGGMRRRHGRHGRHGLLSGTRRAQARLGTPRRQPGSVVIPALSRDRRGRVRRRARPFLLAADPSERLKVLCGNRALTGGMSVAASPARLQIPLDINQRPLGP